MPRRKPENISGKSNTDIIADMGVEMTEGYSLKRDRVMGNHKHPDNRGGSDSSSEGRNQARSTDRAERIKTRLAGLWKTFRSRRKAKEELSCISDHIRKDIGIELHESNKNDRLG